MEWKDLAILTGFSFGLMIVFVGGTLWFLGGEKVVHENGSNKLLVPRRALKLLPYLIAIGLLGQLINVGIRLFSK
jgi:hypothetical protein